MGRFVFLCLLLGRPMVPRHPPCHINPKGPFVIGTGKSAYHHLRKFKSKTAFSVQYSTVTGQI